MKKFQLLMICLIWIHFLNAQMVYTGGPLNTAGQCWAIWASADSAFMGYNEGLYRTIDGGTSWEHLTNGIPADADPRTIEFSNNKLIVGTNDGSRIYQSDDFGNSFIGGTGTITSIAIPTASSSGPNNSMIGGTLFQPYTFDFNTNDWISTGGTGFVTTHGIRYLGGDTIWINRGGVTSGTTSYSHDNGMTWTDVINEPQTDVGGGVILSSVAQDFLKVGNRILVGTNLTGFPVLFTDDYGTTWQASNLPLTTWSDYGKRFIKINDNHLLTVNLSGIWKSTDQGATWILIKTISKIRTFAVFNGNHLLVGTDNGVCEYDNYGEGALIKKHGTTATSSNLILLQNGNILVGTLSGISEFNPSTGLWSTFQDTTVLGQALSANYLAKVNDTLYAMSGNAYFKSGDNGLTFTSGSTAQFSGQTPSAIAILDNKKIVATQNSGGFQMPKIFYSTDNGATYTEASFTNSISLGYGGLGGNIVENLMETSGSLIADMQAGYAISTDGGLNWTFVGGVWDVSFLAVKGTDIYHYRSTSLPIPERIIEISTDGGANWTNLTQNGLPNSGGANYSGIWGVWNLDGKISTYNSFEATRGIYQFNSVSDQWELLPNSSATIENQDDLLHLHAFNGEIYANWLLNGTWRLGGPLGAPQENMYTENVLVYPNPAISQLNVISESPVLKLEVFDRNGKRVMLNENPLHSTIDVSNLEPGLYIIRYVNANGIGNAKFVKM